MKTQHDIAMITGLRRSVMAITASASARIVAVAFVGLALAALLFEHHVHLLGLLPYPVQLCPLMHLFMHGDHHQGHGASRHTYEARHPTQGGES